MFEEVGEEKGLEMARMEEKGPVRGFPRFPGQEVVLVGLEVQQRT